MNLLESFISKLPLKAQSDSPAARGMFLVAQDKHYTAAAQATFNIVFSTWMCMSCCCRSTHDFSFGCAFGIVYATYASGGLILLKV